MVLFSKVILVIILNLRSSKKHGFLRDSTSLAKDCMQREKKMEKTTKSQFSLMGIYSEIEVIGF